MSFVNVFVSRPSKLFVKDNQLHVTNDQGDNVFVVSDINCVLVENLYTTITAYALQYLACNQVAVFICNEKHIPTSINLPYNTYCRPLSVLQQQQALSKPRIKQLWKSIVVSKVQGQAKVLQLTDRSGYKRLTELATQVASGDTANVEATSASIYFKEYLDGGNRRDNSMFVNTCLDYCYAIVRGIIARTLVVYGFQPCIGLHHCSTLNAFNLADDLIEPFRPVVDLWVDTFVTETEMTTQVKYKMFQIVNAELSVDNNNCTLTYAVELLVQSLKKCLTDEHAQLKLPHFGLPKIHNYV